MNELPHEYQKYLEENARWFEGVFRGVSSRIDYTNILLSQLVHPQPKPEPEEPIIFPSYKKISLNLSEARDNREYPISGNFIYIENPVDVVVSSITIRLDDAINDELNLLTLRQIRGPFTKFYITNTVGTGILTLVIGILYAFDISPLDKYIEGLTYEEAIAKLNIIIQLVVTKI